MGGSFLAFWLYIPLAGLALLGVMLLYFALFRDRSKSRRRCPKCWYDMSGAHPNPPVRCPECGHVSQTERQLARTHRNWWLATIAYLLMVPLLVFFAVRDGPRVYYAVMPKWILAEEIRVNGTRACRYVVRGPSDTGGRFVLTSGGKTMLDVEDYDIEFGQYERPMHRGPSQRNGAGEDINRDGTLDLVVFAYSGGAHCCYTVYFVALSDPARIMATIDGRNGIGLKRRPADANHEDVELNLPDQSFDYWNSPHAGSPFPDVRYRLGMNGLELSLDRMLRPSSEVLARYAHTDEDHPGQHFLNMLPGTSNSNSSALNTSLWACMLDLLYSGNEEECWKFFDTNWPADFPGPPSKDAFKQDFLATLNKSPQWQDFQAARTAVAQGKLIPPATVGNYKPPSPSSPTPPP